MKKAFLITLIFVIKFNCQAQDSTFLPKGPLGKSHIIIFNSIKYLPVVLGNIVDSINGSPLHIYEVGEKELDKNYNPQKPIREFRRFEKYTNAWLLTYLHRGDKNHIHFIVFSVKKGGTYKLTAGISEYDIDSISTLERKKIEKSITFINLQSKSQKHKF
ncbi:MAG: hypothetical protein H7Y86_06240 [Rhizobacter sp.]|nr:hypothetical protein [Ferruginibacter sp.]